jgi:hypothetical protein
MIYNAELLNTFKIMHVYFFCIFSSIKNQRITVKLKTQKIAYNSSATPKLQNKYANFFTQFDTQLNFLQILLTYIVSILGILLCQNLIKTTKGKFRDFRNVFSLRH